MQLCKEEVEGRQKVASGELSSLGRVFHRIAMTDGSKLQQVLSVLLPRLLQRIGSNHKLQQECDDNNNEGTDVARLKQTYHQIHAKLVEMLSHIMKRVRDDQSCELPCAAILQLLYDPGTLQVHSTTKVDPFTLNLSLAFLTLGLPRIQQIASVQALLPGCLLLLAEHHPSSVETLSGSPARKGQGNQVAHLLLRTIERVVREGPGENMNQSATVAPTPSQSTLAGVKAAGASDNSQAAGPASRDADSSPMEQARRLVQENESVAEALFDLLLDALLYQPSASVNMPPPGLSQAGHERLLSGNSEKWGAEMASSRRLMEYKIALLDFVSPMKRWGIFLGQKTSSSSQTRGTAQTVALLVVATGDAHVEVVERAQLILKAHLETTRDRGAMGDILPLSCSLLSLCVGEANAEIVLHKNKITLGEKSPRFTLGRYLSMEDVGQDKRQLVLSWKRRSTGEKTSSGLMKFVANQVLDETPIWNADELQLVGALSIAAANQWLLSTAGTMALSTLRAAPYLAAAQLLNALTVRLTSLLDKEPETALSSPLMDLLAMALSTSCSLIRNASTPRPAVAAGTNDGSLAMRDACYGVVCTLSRSMPFVSRKEGYIFRCGSAGDENSFVSIDTAKLLFGCAANEEEKLRPRAVAALDALLGAYCRRFDQVENTVMANVVSTEPMQMESASENPWSHLAAEAPVSDAKRPRTANDTAIFLDKEALARALLPLLWSASRSSQPKASRVAAARWCSDLIKTLDLANACHILCFLAGDSDVTAASLAREGLGLNQKIGEPYEDIASVLEDATLPGFSEFVELLFPSENAGSGRPRFFDFSHQGKAAALRFGLMSLFNDLYGGEDSAVVAYVRDLSETLFVFLKRGSTHGRDSVDLLDECSICLAGCLSTSQFARSLIVRGGTQLRLQDVEALAMCASSSKARRYLAEACGHIYEDSSQWSNTKMELDEWVERSEVLRAMKACSEKLEGLQSGQFVVSEVHGGAFLGASCVRAFRMLASRSDAMETSSVCDCWRLTDSIIASLGLGTVHTDEVIGNACAQAMSIALSFPGLDSPILDNHLFSGATSGLTKLAEALRKYGHGDHTDATRTALSAKAAGVALAATTAGAGFVGKVSSESDKNAALGPARMQCIDALFALLGSSSFRKDPEIALVAGEALALCADSYSPDNAVWSSNSCEWPENYSQEFADGLSPHQHVLYVLLNRDVKASSPHKRTACGPALLAIVARAARNVNGDVKLANRFLTKEILQRINVVQNSFLLLLSDPKSKQLVRESSCLGLAACYGLAQAVSKIFTEVDDSDRSLGQGLNENLLRAFGQTTNYGQSAMMETASQAATRRGSENTENEGGVSLVEPFGMDTEVGGAAGLGEAALGAYREMAAAALALDRPDVLYSLLILSVSSSVWFSPGMKDRYNAATLLGESSLVGSRTNASAMRVALRPHLSKLIPRLLRARHDPNKRTAEQMETLWIGLTGGGAEARAAVTDHLLHTIDVLVDDASNRLWRARVGACGALAEVVAGRSWYDLGGGPEVLDDDEVLDRNVTSSTSAGVRLLRLWRVAVRALDDVRLAVRESGQSLARSIRALTIRLCDPSALQDSGGDAVSQTEHSIAAKAAAATSLRWLVKHGLNQPCAEATGISISTLLGIVDVVQPTTLQPLLPELVESLLMAMSGLEPAALNYLQVRSAGRDSSGASYDRLERARLQVAQTGPIGRALGKCLDMMPSINVSSQKEVIPRLDSALRCGAGFATRAATADAVSTLCNACPLAFKFPGSSTSNPTVRLLRALYFASERERGQAAKDKMAHALGNLAALAPGPSVRSLATRACERYSAATGGNNDDPAARRAAAAALRALAVRASKQFADGGPSDVWCRRVLPLAFLGQKDEDGKIASLWKEVWDEGGIAASGAQEGKNVSGVLLEEKLLPYLVRACTDALGDVSWARRVTASTALVELCDIGILAPVGRNLQCKMSVSPDDMMRAKRRAQASREALKSCMLLLVKPRIWRGKASVVKATAKLACKWVSIDDSADGSALGWNESIETCPWTPIVLTAENTLEDLFVGDGWFKVSHEVTDESPLENLPLQISSESPGESDNPDEYQDIDFSEADQILDSAESDPRDVTDNAKNDINTLAFSGICRTLIGQGLCIGAKKAASYGIDDEVLPYRAAALEGLSELLQALSSRSDPGRKTAAETRILYRLLSPHLVAAIDMDDELELSVGKADEPPLIKARSADCLAAAIWNGVGNEPMNDTEDVQKLARLFRTSAGPKQAAWTVRESSVLAAASLASKCDTLALRHHDTIEALIDIASYALKDRKFWRVRHAGLKMLNGLVNRAGTGADNSTAFSLPGSSLASNSTAEDRQQLLEALLPYKETILKLARTALTDSEAKVTSAGRDICSAMAWWP